MQRHLFRHGRGRDHVPHPLQRSYEHVVGVGVPAAELLKKILFFREAKFLGALEITYFEKVCYSQSVAEVCSNMFAVLEGAVPPHLLQGSAWSTKKNILVDTKHL